ncbi:MAG: putative ORFan [Satyrvirus sp.]|uniref:Putative ORFan n=1 Tax=Satyrvirus sp. TaxID=2487771 RepID=A0A3G5AIK0_9VIRU|nr:MAG: putative ORFan [Satyrvirus sp.]
MPKKNIEYTMFSLVLNRGSDMNGVYFIQYTGNEKAFKKFRRINKKNKDLICYDQLFSYDEMKELTKCYGLIDSGAYDNNERFILSGKLKVPGENRAYSVKYDKKKKSFELDTWWEKYLDDTKFPEWKNIIEKVTDFGFGRGGTKIELEKDREEISELSDDSDEDTSENSEDYAGSNSNSNSDSDDSDDIYDFDDSDDSDDTDSTDSTDSTDGSDE